MLGFPKERLFHIRALLFLVVFGGCGGGGCGCSTDAENFLAGGRVSVEPLELTYCCDPDAPPPEDGYDVGKVTLTYDLSDADAGQTDTVYCRAVSGIGVSVRNTPADGAFRLKAGTPLLVDVYAQACIDYAVLTLEVSPYLPDDPLYPKGARKLYDIAISRDCPEPPPPGDGVPTDIQIIGPEAVTQSDIGATTDHVLVAGSNGWALIDASTGATVDDKGLQVGGARYVAAEVADQGTGTIAVCAVGPAGGTLTHWIPAQLQFGVTQLFDTGSNLTDLAPFPDGQGAVLVDNTSGQISLLAFDAGISLFAIRGFPEYIDAFAYTGASGNAVSAFTDGADARVYFVTDGQPGELWKHEDADRPLGAATLLANVGNDPRRVRVLGNLIVVSNFGDDTLTVTRVDTGAVVATVPVGDGPIGIDLKDLGGGQVGVASTGFNDHTWSITVLAQDGTVVSNEKHNLPAQCRAPGHILWHKDGVLVSCHDTDNLFYEALP